MKLQNQRTLEVLEAQKPEYSGEDKGKDKIHTYQPYRTPEVFLVGKAKRLMAAYAHGNEVDAHGLYYQSF